MGDAVVYSFIGTFLLFFLTIVAGIPPAIAGTIAALGSVWDVLASAFTGYISDNSKSRLGKRKPFILVGSFPLGVATALLFTYVDMSQGMRVVYYAVMLLILWTAFCVFYVPYLAWGAELTRDYDERTSLRGYVYIYNTMGGAIGSILPTIIVDALLQIGRNEQQSWQAVGIFCGAIAFLSVFIGAAGIRDKAGRHTAGAEEDVSDADVSGAAKPAETADEANVPGAAEPADIPGAAEQAPAGPAQRLGFAIDILRNFWEILHLRSARCIILASIFFLLANTMLAADRMYFYTFNLHLSGKMISVIMAFQSFVSVIFVPLVISTTKAFDKRIVFLAGMGMSFAAAVIYGIAGIGSVLHMFIYSFFLSVGSICYWQLIASMVYDVCEADQLVNGKERSGMVISMQSISESLSEAVALQLLGIILGLAGFDGSLSVQPDLALRWTHISLTLIPALFMLLSLIMIWRYPITKKMYHRILRALESPSDEDDFSHL